MTRDGALSSGGGRPTEPQLVNPAIWQFCGKTLSLIFSTSRKVPPMRAIVAINTAMLKI